MHSGKSVGPRMEPWGIPALTGYSFEGFPFRTTRSCPLLRKFTYEIIYLQNFTDELRPNIWLEIPFNLSLWRRWTCQVLLKAMNISSATARVAPDLLKALAIQSDTTVRRSEVDREDLKAKTSSNDLKRPKMTLNDLKRPKTI